MKTIVIVLLLGAAGYYGYKYFIAARATTGGETSAQFIHRCSQASADVAKPADYCACLQRKGVKTMVSLATDPASRAAVTSCQAEVGHTAPQAGAPEPAPGQPAPTGRGRTADHLTNQLQKAYQQRAP